MATAYITGGASGLGKATAEMLVKNGYQYNQAEMTATKPSQNQSLLVRSERRGP